MTLGLYVPGASLLHRLSPAPKLAALVATGLGVFFIDDPLALSACAAIAFALLAAAGASLAETGRQLRPVALLLGIVFLAHGLFTSWSLGLVVVLRFAVILLLALAVTFTTRVSDMIETLERGLAPLAAIGINPAKVSLALSLTLRFIPVIAEQAREIRNAQRARGLDRNLVALTMPLLVKTLRLSITLTEAIEARGWDPEDHHPRRDEDRERRS